MYKERMRAAVVSVGMVRLQSVALAGVLAQLRLLGMCSFGHGDTTPSDAARVRHPLELGGRRAESPVPAPAVWALASPYRRERERLVPRFVPTAREHAAPTNAKGLHLQAFRLSRGDRI